MAGTSLLFAILLTGASRVASGPGYLGPGGGKSWTSIGDCYKDYAYLRQRFSFEQLNFFCQQWRQYNELIAIDNNTLGMNPFTDSQKAYLDSLRLDLNATGNTSHYSIRKEIRSMTEDERLLFQMAVRSLKWDKIDNMSKYDLLVTLHHPALAPGAYVGAAFLPWHREYLRTFERALQKVNSYVTLPYWDTTLDIGLENPADSVLWSDLFLGNGTGLVHDGPFHDWAFETNDTSTPLERNVSGNGRLMTQDDIDWFLKQIHFRYFSACIDLRLEQTSRAVHEWVGGCMQDLYYSPQDPVFYLYHAFLDYLMEEWRRNKTVEELAYGYPTNIEACSKYHYASSPMSPFEPLRNIDGFSPLYTKLYFNYEPRPTCSPHDPKSCKSHYLFCNVNESRCMTKIVEGGNCFGLGDAAADQNPCYQSKCINGRCTVTDLHDFDDSLNTPPLKLGDPIILQNLVQTVDKKTNTTFFTKRVKLGRGRKNSTTNVAKRRSNVTTPVPHVKKTQSG